MDYSIGACARKVCLAKVAYRRIVPARFVLALAVVCNRDFQSPGLARIPGWVFYLSATSFPKNSGWSTQAKKNLLSSSALQGGVVDAQSSCFFVIFQESIVLLSP